MVRNRIMSGIAALAIAGAAAAGASAQGYDGGQRQPGGYGQQGGYAQPGRGDFWSNAPQSARERIDWLQQRIQRGVADGSLDRREARSSQAELNDIRRMAMNFSRRDGRNLSPSHADQIQGRLDSLSQRIRWQRNGGYGAAGVGRPGERDRYSTDYDAARDYRDGPNYQERRLAENDQVYRGSDGRYYCKRNDGTTGLVVGAVGGGVIGNVIDGGHNRVAGTLIGGALGALAGKAIDQSSNVSCR